MKEEMDYLRERLLELLAIDSPTGFTDKAADWVQKAFSELTKGRTVIMIAHRLTTVMGADRILCLGDGRLLGEGTHAELMKNCPAYREICRSQMGGEDA